MTLALPLWLIAAVARNGVIGHHNDLPWRFPEDLQYFKQKTLGHPVIMGRKNWESFKGRPLKGRPNLVVSRTLTQADLPPGARLCPDLESAIGTARMLGAEQPPFIIGGAEIYRQALPLVTRMYLTDIPGTPDGDVFFPAFDASQWREDGRWTGADGTLVYRVLERIMDGSGHPVSQRNPA
jgi:dihydrofolate reductase